MALQEGGSIESKLMAMMSASGALLEGHFLLTSGLHSGNYLQCAMLLRYPENAAFVGEAIGRQVADLNPEVIVSPALGGIIVGHEVARWLGVEFLFCEREDGKMKLRRFPHPGRRRAVVVEDVITTGTSSREVGEYIAQGGANWVGTACIVDRSSGKAVFPTPLFSLWRVSFQTYERDSCPLCRAGIPLVKPGSR